MNTRHRELFTNEEVNSSAASVTAPLPSSTPPASVTASNPESSSPATIATSTTQSLSPTTQSLDLGSYIDKIKKMNTTLILNEYRSRNLRQSENSHKFNLSELRTRLTEYIRDPDKYQSYESIGKKRKRTETEKQKEVENNKNPSKKRRMDDHNNTMITDSSLQLTA